MKKLFQCVFMVSLLFLVLSGLSTTVWAIPITMQFTATDFVIVISAPHEAPNLAPIDPVTGTIVWDATSVNSPINSLTSINLTIDGHTYALSEVDFSSATVPEGTFMRIFGSVAEEFVDSGTDDFFVSWNRTSLEPDSFIIYTSRNTLGAWATTNFTSFSITSSITSAPVPEAANLLLLGISLVGLMGFRRKFRK